jgi:O-antigen/teichoic acid export membrane protein
LAKIKDDEIKFTDSFRKVLLINIFVMAPIAVGMSAVAKSLFEVLLGERWLPTVPYFEIISLAGVFYPLSMVAYNVLKVYSNGAIIFRLELLKKAIMTAVLALTIPHSTMAIAWGLVAMTVVEFAVNFAATRRYTTLSWWSMFRAIIPSLLLTAVMLLSVFAGCGNKDNNQNEPTKAPELTQEVTGGDENQVTEPTAEPVEPTCRDAR